MKPTTLLVAIAAILATATLGATYDGYLIDRASLDSGMADTVAVWTNPDKYTVKSALTASAKAAGYSIVSGTTMVNLSSTANEVAAGFLISLEDTRANVRVRANGAVSGGELVLSDLALWDIGLDTSATHKFSGYMVDRICLDKIVGFDKANMMEGPEMHSVKCLLYQPCVDSGFALLLKKRDTTVKGYGAIYNFTAATNTKVKTWGETLSSDRNNLLATFSGTVNADGVIEMTDSAPTGTGTNVKSGAGSLAALGTVALIVVAALLL